MSLRKTGTGVWRLAAANAYTGETVLEGGTLVADVSELDPEARAVRFAKVTEGELAAPPEVTIVGGEPGQDWHVTSAGGVFKVGVRKGMVLIVK